MRKNSGDWVWIWFAVAALCFTYSYFLFKILLYLFPLFNIARVIKEHFFFNNYLFELASCYIWNISTLVIFICCLIGYNSYEFKKQFYFCHLNKKWTEIGHKMGRPTIYIHFCSIDAKGQLISKRPFGVFKLTRVTTKFLLEFLP